MGWVREFGINFCLFSVSDLQAAMTPDDGHGKSSRVSTAFRATSIPRIEERFDLVLREAFG
jgi:hypothetical protein